MSMWGSEDVQNAYANYNRKKKDKAGWLDPLLTAGGAVAGSLLMPGVGTMEGASLGAGMGHAAGSVGHSLANGQVDPMQIGQAALTIGKGYQAGQGNTPQTSISPQGGGTQPMLPDPYPQDNAQILQTFMQNPQHPMFQQWGQRPNPQHLALGGFVGPTSDPLGLWARTWGQGDPGASSSVLGAIPGQVQQMIGQPPVQPTVGNGQLGALQTAQHPTLEALSALLPQIMAAMPRPANPKNTKAIGAWAPALGLAASAPAAIAQSRRASANAPIQAGNESRQADYEARKKAYEAQQGTLMNTLAGNATKPFAEPNPAVNRMDQLAPATTLAGLKAPAWVHTWGDLKEWQQSVTNDRLAKSAATAGAGAASQQDLPGDANTAADEIASFRGEPKIPTSNRYPGYSGLVTSLANQKLKANGSPYTVQQLQTLWKEKQNWLTTNNAQRFTLLRQAAVTVRKHIQQMKAFYKTYGNLARPSGINTVGKSQFDLALEGVLGADARAAAEQLALNQDFVTGEAALVMSAGFAPHKEVVDRMAKRLQVATKGKSAGLATINALESLVGARVQAALESTPFAGGKKNPYLIDVSPIEGWNEAGVSEEQPKKKSGWMPKGAVEVKGN